MEDARSVGNFQNFPDELLLEIFQFMTIEELVTCVQNVSIRWKCVTHTSKLWKKLAYNPPSTKSDDDVISLLKQMPQLRTFIFNSSSLKVDEIIDTICSQCKHLHSLVCGCTVITTSHLEKILNSLPNIEYLQLSQWQMMDESTLDILGQFKNLKKLTCVNIGPNSKYILNDTPIFESLEHIEMIAYCAEELESHEGEGNMWNSSHFFHLLCQFKNLKHLSVDFRMLHFSGFEAIFSNISKLQNLKTLCFKSLFHSDKEILTRMFNLSTLPNLWKIDLSNCLNLNVRTVQAISKNCPSVRELCFSRCVYFDDQCAEALVQLPVLRCLDLSCCNRVSEIGIAALSRCPKLETLDLSWRVVVPHYTLKVVSTLPFLKTLVLNHTEIIPEDIAELLTSCSHITYLSLYCCSGIDNDTLQKFEQHCKITCNHIQDLKCPYRKMTRISQ